MDLFERKIPYLKKKTIICQQSDLYGVICVIGQFRFIRVGWYLQLRRMLGKYIFLCAVSNHSSLRADMSVKRHADVCNVVETKFISEPRTD